MAGIGFELQKMARRDSLLGPLGAFGASAILSAGPWLATVAALLLLNRFGAFYVAEDELATVRSIVIYNFSISLALTAPIAAVATRTIADALYAGEAREGASVFLAALALCFVTQTPAALGVHLVLAKLSPPMAAIAVASYFLTAGLWIASVFLSTLRDYASVARAFGAGMAVAIAAGALGGSASAIGFLSSFTGGLAVTFFLIAARVLTEFSAPLEWPARFFAAFRKHWQLALAGFAYNAGIWADKWAMWFAPGRYVPETGLVTNPAYDGAMFAAQLALIPALAAFLIFVETDFFGTYRRYFRAIDGHKPFAAIERRHAELKRSGERGLLRLLALELMVTLIAVMLSPPIAEALGLYASQYGMFRLGLIAAGAHALFFATGVFLAYLDLKAKLVWLNAIFLAANAAFTLGALAFGFPYYGFGYVAASVLAAVTGALMALDAFQRLPFLTFVGNNPAVRARA